MKKSTLTALLAVTAAATVSSAAAQARISAQSIIVNPVQPDLSVSVSVNKDPSGNQNPLYRIDEPITVSATVSRDAYVYIFDVDARGEVNQILPNRLGGDNFVRAGTTRSFPAPGDNFTFNVGGPAGQSKVLALASLTPLNLQQISEFKTTQDQFATVTTSTQAGLAQALSIVVNPLPQNSWVSDTAFYSVAAVQQVTTGGLFIGTNVNNATVILNGQRLGGSNVTYSNLRAGTYPVRVQAPGYNDFTTTLTIRAGQTVNLSVDLTPTQVALPAVQLNTGNAVLDFLGSLLGAVTNTQQIQDPARTAYDQKVADLRADGYALQQTRATNTGFVGTMTKGSSTITLTVDRGTNRTVRVNVSETTIYRY